MLLDVLAFTTPCLCVVAAVALNPSRPIAAILVIITFGVPAAWALWSDRQLRKVAEQRLGEIHSAWEDNRLDDIM